MELNSVRSGVESCEPNGSMPILVLSSSSQTSRLRPA
jgi:hypothetical protein